MIFLCSQSRYSTPREHQKPRHHPPPARRVARRDARNDARVLARCGAGGDPRRERVLSRRLRRRVVVAAVAPAPSSPPPHAAPYPRAGGRLRRRVARGDVGDRAPPPRERRRRPPPPARRPRDAPVAIHSLRRAYGVEGRRWGLRLVVVVAPVVASAVVRLRARRRAPSSLASLTDDADGDATLRRGDELPGGFVEGDLLRSDREGRTRAEGERPTQRGGVRRAQVPDWSPYDRVS